MLLMSVLAVAVVLVGIAIINRVRASTTAMARGSGSEADSSWMTYGYYDGGGGGSVDNGCVSGDSDSPGDTGCDSGGSDGGGGDSGGGDGGGGGGSD
jgi:hypothetical protein